MTTELLVFEIILQFLIFAFCISIGLGCFISALILQKELTNHTVFSYIVIGIFLSCIGLFCLTKYADYIIYFPPLKYHLPIFVSLFIVLIILFYKFNVKLFMDNAVKYYCYCKKICKYIESFNQDKIISEESKFLIIKIIKKLEDLNIILNLKKAYKWDKLKNELSDSKLTYGELRKKINVVMSVKKIRK